MAKAWSSQRLTASCWARFWQAGHAWRGLHRRSPFRRRCCFCGRESEAAELIGVSSQDSGASPAICVVTGKPGIGKTPLAWHVANQPRAAGRVPDGLLYVNLQGAGPLPARAKFRGGRCPGSGADCEVLPDGPERTVGPYHG
jgi:hypothetical protein